MVPSWTSKAYLAGRELLNLQHAGGSVSGLRLRCLGCAVCGRFTALDVAHQMYRLNCRASQRDQLQLICSPLHEFTSLRAADRNTCGTERPWLQSAANKMSPWISVR